jgi:hypothetical protein
MLHLGDEEATRCGVLGLGGVVDGAGAHVVVHPLVRGHNIAGVVPVPLHPLLDAAALRRTPVVAPKQTGHQKSQCIMGRLWFNPS